MRPFAVPIESTPRIRFWGARHAFVRRFLAMALLAVISLSMGWLGLNGLQAAKARQRLERQLSELADVNPVAPFPGGALGKPKVAPRTRLTLGQTRATDLDDDTRRHLNTVVRQLNTPWQDLFKQLERLTPPEVALLSIEPDTRRDTIKLQAEAKTLDALLVYAAGLEQQGLLGRLTYSKHETNDQDPNKPTRLSFELEVRIPDRLDVLQESLNAPVLPPGKAALAMAGKKL
jgi:hypothetical protein